MIRPCRFWQANTALLIVTILLVSSIPSLIAQTETMSFDQGLNPEDGVYFTSTFDDVDDFYDGCIRSIYGNRLILDPDTFQNKSYNFSGWSSSSSHKAYDGWLPWASPYWQLSWIMNLFGKEVEEGIHYLAMAKEDGVMYPADRQVKSSPFPQFHHFRFKITQEVGSISSFNITWIGNAENFKNIALYAWKPSVRSLGNWEELHRIPSNSSLIRLNYDDDDIELDDTNYLDLLIVVVPLSGKACFIQTDYINVNVQGTGYATEGAARFRPIRPENIDRWERFIWTGYEKPNTKISFQFFNEQNGSHSPIKNTIIPGNSAGISNAVVDLSRLPIDTNLTVNVTLKTTDLSVTPELYSWGVSWQTSNESWMDQFSSDLRVEQNKLQNIRIADGKATLVTTVYDWPMFGQNPTNNRVSSGFGPGTHDSLCWWVSDEEVGGGQKNPIIYNGILYVSSAPDAPTNRIYAYDTEYPLSPVSNVRIDHSHDLGYDIQNSPAATSKNSIIVATGSSKAGGEIANKVFSLNANDLQMKEWDFSYHQVDASNPAISYHASPVIKDEKIFLTSWNGDSSLIAGIFDFINFSKGNNKLICINDHGSFEWSQVLPAGSFSSPAVGDNIVIAGCEKLGGESLQAFTLAGTKRWGIDVGPIGYASPVIHENTVYVVSKKVLTFPGVPFGTNAFTQVLAVDMTNRMEKWNTTIGSPFPEFYMNAAQSTPVIANGYIYVASPDGLFYKINAQNGEIVNSIRIYTKAVHMNVVRSSPAYADGIIYIGTPDGYMHAINAVTLEVIWKKSSSPIVSSPVLADGFVYYIDEENFLYCRGKKQIREDELITGELISKPITLPDTDLYWDRFMVSDNIGPSSTKITYSILRENYAVLINTINHNERLSHDVLKNVDTIRLKASFQAQAKETVSIDSWEVTFVSEPPPGKTVFRNFQKNMIHPAVFSVDVQNNVDGLINTSARFKLDYSNESTGTVETGWLPANFTGENGTKAEVTIIVNMSYFEFTNKIDSFHRIQFKINDSLNTTTYSSWYTIEGRPDLDPPLFIIDSFSPDPPFISSFTPVCTIQARDTGSNGNSSGINVQSARYSITYEENGTKKTHSQRAECTGINGTTGIVTITADISKSDVHDNITLLESIRFYIEDMAGNKNQTDWITLFYDNTPPSSTITNKMDIPSISNASSVLIKASATDNDTSEEYVSGVRDIKLYYRKQGSETWKQFGTPCESSQCEWEFSIEPKEGGEYELCSIATDNASNQEEFPDEGDVFFLYDPNPPWVIFPDEIIDITDDIHLPSFDQVIFEDDYRLHKIFYRLDFEGNENWTLITEADTMKINPEWSLTQTQWDKMIEDEITYVFFKVIDSLGNTFTTPSTNEAIRIRKDLEDTELDKYILDIEDFSTWRWDNTYTIRVSTRNMSISKVTLWHRFGGEDLNATASNNWTQYGEMRNASPFEWTFSPKQGTGYYQFKAEVLTPADDVLTTSIQTVYITLFPIMELIVALLITMILFAVSGIVLKKYRHTKLDKKKPFL